MPLAKSPSPQGRRVSAKRPPYRLSILAGPSNPANASASSVPLASGNNSTTIAGDDPEAGERIGTLASTTPAHRGSSRPRKSGTSKRLSSTTGVSRSRLTAASKHSGSNGSVPREKRRSTSKATPTKAVAAVAVAPTTSPGTHDAGVSKAISAVKPKSRPKRCPPARGSADAARRRKSAPPADRAAATIAQFVRTVVILQPTLRRMGALADRVMAQQTRDDALHRVRVRAAKRTLAAFFNDCIAPLAMVEVGPESGADSEPSSRRGSGVVAVVPRRLEKHRQVIEAAFFVKRSLEAANHRRLFHVYVKAVRVIESAWMRTPRFAALGVESVKRKFLELFERHEALERRDLERLHLLFMVSTHQKFYNSDELLGCGLATRKEQALYSFLDACMRGMWAAIGDKDPSAGRQSPGVRSPEPPFTDTDGGPTAGEQGHRRSSTDFSELPSLSDAYSSFSRVVEEEAEVRRYERRLFFSREERDLLRELGLMDADPTEFKERHLLDDAEACEAAWLESALQVRIYDRVLRGLLAAKTRGPRARVVPYDERVRLATGAELGRRTTAARLSTFADSTTTRRVTTRAVRMRPATAEAERGRMPGLLLRLQRAQGALQFNPQLEGGGAIVSAADWLGGHGRDAKEEDESESEDSTDSDNDVLAAVRGRQPKTKVVIGAPDGAVPVLPSSHACPLHTMYATLVSVRRTGEVQASAASSTTAAAVVVPMGETPAALRVSGHCDWLTESYLNPLTKPAESSKLVHADKPATDGAATAASPPASPLSVREPAAAPAPRPSQRVHHGIETLMWAPRAAGEPAVPRKVLFTDLLHASFGSTRREATASAAE